MPYNVEVVMLVYGLSLQRNHPINRVAEVAMQKVITQAVMWSGATN